MTVTPLVPVVTGRGTVIERYHKTGVGKRVGNRLYLHGFYLWEVGDEVFPRAILERAVHRFRHEWPGWDCRCVMLDLKTHEVRFDHAPLFDVEREPMVGDMFTVHPHRPLIFRRHSNAIWHHRWLWVKDDYKGFDVAESRAWSARYLPLIAGAPKGSVRAWARQLDAAGIIKIA